MNRQVWLHWGKEVDTPNLPYTPKPSEINLCMFCLWYLSSCSWTPGPDNCTLSSPTSVWGIKLYKYLKRAEPTQQWYFSGLTDTRWQPRIIFFPCVLVLLANYNTDRIIWKGSAPVLLLSCKILQLSVTPSAWLIHINPACPCHRLTRHANNLRASSAWDH